ncbi:AfsR/SARP family transcriptional regulator [Desulfosarcina ovata]|uniref:Transcriptional activator n=1 Tax=Desulfosarcina ovata subsp. ovata TaxID=2752305 RepID=A0A5K8ADB4_9BACT|nr:BTAD domain-containing putative transcriptional regulator [Desulfosarcina ovata]BBO90561.1 transcriptional activator [Desulfosarcina ovata subsp. ovata]
MTQIEFLFFGPPCFRVNGTAVKIGRRKAVALAAYLAVTGKVHSREKLATMFWPESDPARSRASLRKALWLMAKTLGTSWLSIDRETIGFVPHANLQVDVNRFLECAAVLPQKEGEVGENRPEPFQPERINALEEAAQICKRSFLSGFSLNDAPDFEDWQLEQAEYLKGRAAEVLGFLARFGINRGTYSQAVSHARQLVALDPLDEGAQRLLIRLYEKAGHPGLAIRQYEKCKALLEKELGVLPEDKTTALGERIRNTNRDGQINSDNAPPRTNLPARSTCFVGRKDDINALVGKITAPEVRLLTLTGPGGIGKTRLALELAEILMNCFPDGVFFIGMAGLRTPGELAGELLKALGPESDRKTGLEGQIVNFLRHRKALLVMDNFEHLAEGGGLVLTLLEQAPNLNILVTSRIRLMLEGEHLFPVPDLSRPPLSGREKAVAICRAEETWDAVALFLSAARRVRPTVKLDADNFQAVSRICDLTGGMPLALILAAGWMDVFPPEKIADRIRESLDFLRTDIRDMPERHQSILAVLDTSWTCLSKEEKDLLMKLAAFRHSFTLEAVSRVMEIEPETAVRRTTGLARKSLLRADPETGRFEMHPLLRQYAGKRLSASGLEDEVLDAHKHHYLDLARDNEPGLIGERMLACREKMDAEFPNIRQAWFRAVDQQDLFALIRAVKGVYVYFDMHTRYHESKALFQPAKTLVMEMAGAEPCPDMALIPLCWLDMATTERLAARQASELKDRAGQWLRLAVKRKDRSGRAYALLLMGAVAQKEKAWDKAIRLFGLGLKAYPGIERAFWVTVRMGLCRQAQGRMDKAIEYFRQGHKAGTEAGDEIKKAWTLCNIGICEVGKGNLESGQPPLQAAADAFDRIRAPIGMMTAYEELGLISLLNGDLARADSLTDRVLDIAKDLGLALPRFKNALALKGLISIAADHPRRAETFLIQAQEGGQPLFMAHLGMTFLACLTKDPANARFHLEAADKTLPSVHKPHLNLLYLLARAWVWVAAGQDLQAAEALGAVYHHPLYPVGLFRVWNLPGQLLGRLKSGMAPSLAMDG